MCAINLLIKFLNINAKKYDMALGFGILLAFCALFSWAFGDFLIQRSTRKVGDVQTLAIIGIVGSIGLLPFIIKDFPLLGYKENIILLASLDTLTFVDAILNFEALKEGKLSIIDVVMEIELPVTAVLSYIILKEYLTTMQLIIVASIFIGIILIATKSFSHWKTKIEKGVWIALATAVLMGVVNFMTAVSSKKISPLMAIWFPWMIYGVISLIVIWRREGLKNFAVHVKEYKWLLLMTGIMDTAAWVFYAYATKNNNISIITAITESYPAIAMFLGLWLNKECIKWHQYAGAGLALAGSIILSLTI